MPKTKEINKILTLDVKESTCAFCGFPTIKGKIGAACPNCHAKYYYNSLFGRFVWEQE